jgi:hypothetical protein
MMQKSISLFEYNYIKSLHEECEELSIDQALSEDGADNIKHLRVRDTTLPHSHLLGKTLILILRSTLLRKKCNTKSYSMSYMLSI